MKSHTLLSLTQAFVVALASSGVAAAQYDDAPAAPSGNAAKGGKNSDELHFKLDRSPGIVKAGCLQYATGEVHVSSQGPVEVMEISASGLPKNSEFDVFVIQLPNAPFGLAWYQGDLDSDGDGNAHGRYVGRFNQETFIVAPGVGPAPQIHGSPFPDAAENPATAPVHTFHIGIWFNSADDAGAQGCPNTVTPFNGEHDAGVQLFNTASFPDTEGPLSQLAP
jgi:hypothetical protein